MTTALVHIQPRMEFGAPRTNCACGKCRTYCRFMPGYLIPADLDRLIPEDADPFVWAETHLLASPGALVVKDGEFYRIPTLVSATKADGSCIHLTAEGLCDIHENAPFGCAFFDCEPARENINREAHAIIFNAARGHRLYFRLWLHLNSIGRTQFKAEILRARMAAKEEL